MLSYMISEHRGVFEPSYVHNEQFISEESVNFIKNHHIRIDVGIESGNSLNQYYGITVCKSTCTNV